MISKKFLLPLLLILVLLLQSINVKTADASNDLTLYKSSPSLSWMPNAYTMLVLNNGDVLVCSVSNNINTTSYYSILDGTTLEQKQNGSYQSTMNIIPIGQFANGNIVCSEWSDSKYPRYSIKRISDMQTTYYYQVAMNKGDRYAPLLAGFDNLGNAVLTDRGGHVNIIDSSGNKVRNVTAANYSGVGVLTPGKTKMLDCADTSTQAMYLNLSLPESTNLWDAAEYIATWNSDGYHGTNYYEGYFEKMIPITDTRSFLYARNHWEILDTSRGSTWPQRLVASGEDSDVGFCSIMDDNNVFIGGYNAYKIRDGATGVIVKQGAQPNNSIQKVVGDKFYGISDNVVSIYKFASTLPNAPTITSPSWDQKLNINSPTISWNFSDPDAGDYQGWYQVVASNDGFNTWYYDSGVVQSGNQWATIPYLPQGYWNVAVRTWDQTGQGDPPWGFGYFVIDTTPPTVGNGMDQPIRYTNVADGTTIRFHTTNGADSGGSGYEATYFWLMKNSSGSWNPAQQRGILWDVNNWYADFLIQGEGSYWARAHPLDKAGNWNWDSFVDETYIVDRTAPTYSSAEVTNTDENGYDVMIYGVSDDRAGINKVQFPTWTDYNGQDDIQVDWSNSALAAGTDLGGGTWKYHVEKHNNELGQYNTHAYIFDNAGNTSFAALTHNLLGSQIAPTTPVASSITANSVVLTSTPGSMITSNGVTQASGMAWTGLTAATAYTAYAYMPADSTHLQSPNSANANFTTLKLDQAAPSNPTAVGLTSNSVILVSNMGSQITCNGITKASGSTWTGLSVVTEYSAFAYYPADSMYNQSPNSGITNFTTLKADQLAPTTPIYSGVTTSTVVLTSAAGSMITCNGATKASGSTWTGLLVGTEYTAFAYLPGDATHYQSPNSAKTTFTTLKLNQSAPTVPIASSVTSNSVVLTSSTGALITCNGDTKASGSTWTSLFAAKEYTAFAYFPSNSTYYQSPNTANASFTTLKLEQAAPTAPIATGITSNSVTLSSSMGADITCNGVTKASGSTWTGLSVATLYTAFSYYPATSMYNQSPNSGSMSFTTLKLEQVAPITPIATSITGTTVVLTSTAGSQITSNGITKASGSTWNGLSPVTAYTAYAYMPADATHYQSPNSANANFTTIKLDQVAPTIPIASSITTTSVVLTSLVGSQITSNGITKASGSTWNGLTPGSSYAAFAYMPSDTTHNQSPNSASANYTMLKLEQVAAPTIPVASSITVNSVILTSSAGAQVTCNGVTKVSGSTWTGLLPATGYTALAFFPSDATHYQSPNSANANFTTLKLEQTAPTVPIATGITANSVVLTSSMGSQITCNGVTKASGSTWAGLSPITNYTVYAYYPSDATHYQSPNSASTTFTTLKLSQVAPMVPVISGLTPTSVVLTSSAGSLIMSNGETKASGSTWTGLMAGTAYTAYAYFPSDATHYQSPNSASANFTTLNPTVSKPTITSVAGTAPIGDPNPTFAPTTAIKVDFSTTGLINTATIYLKQLGQSDKALGTVAVTSDASGNAIVTHNVTLPTSTVVNLAANVYVKGTNTTIAMTVTSTDSNSFTPTNPIVITPTLNGPTGSALLIGDGYSGYYPGKVIQIGSATDGFISTLRATDPGGASTTFSNQVNPTGYWRNTWPTNGSPQNFTISPTSTWGANYTITMTGNTPFIDTTTGLSQTATGTKTFRLDPKLTITAATATAVASANQTDGNIHPSYPDHSFVNNTVRLDATTSGYGNGITATVYGPTMVELETVTLSVNTGNNQNTTTWTGNWNVPENLEAGSYTFRFSATAHDGQPSVTRDATASAVRDIAVTSASNSIPIATAWQYPSAQPTNQVYPGQVIDLSANTIGEAQSVSVKGSDGAIGTAMTTTDNTLYSSTWSSTFTIPVARKIGETYTLTFTATDIFGSTNTRTLILSILNPLGIVPGSISVTPYDADQGPTPAPTAKLKVTMQLYGWVTSAKINWPAPNNTQVTLIKTVGPDARGMTSWSTDSNGIVVPHDVPCGYPESPVAPVSTPINLALTVSGTSSFLNSDNSANSFSDSNSNVPISDNVKITSFTTSADYANIGDTILLTVITTGFAEAVSVQLPWDATPVILSNSFALPAPYQGIWTANYTIPATAIPDPLNPYTITATATNTFNVMPPAGSTEINTATTDITISALTLDMYGPVTAHRGDTLTFWGTTTGKASTVKLISVSPSIPYIGTDTLVSNLNFVSLSAAESSETNTWYSDQAHANGWVVPSDITDETILTFTFEATDALGLKKQANLQVRIVPIIIVITH